MRAPNGSILAAVEPAAMNEGAPRRSAVADNLQGSIRASYDAIGGRTFASRVYEHGSLRLRHPRGEACRGVLINTGGGVVGGDRLAIDLALGPHAAVTLTTTAAEKIYRSDGAISTMRTKLELGPHSVLTWLPQETILFDRARFRRSLEIELEASASLFAAEMVVFGRTAHGERDIQGCFRDSWRVRRGGRLIYADETCIEGPISAVLAGSAVANGARAVAAVLIASPDAPHVLDGVRAAISLRYDDVAEDRIEGAATLRDGFILARLLAGSPERLRSVVAAVLRAAHVRVPRDSS